MRFLTHKLSTPAALLLLATCVLITANDSRARDPEQPITKVRAADIPERVQIIGFLGHPLGEIIGIRGQWYMPPAAVKDQRYRFRVTHVNGCQLDDSVQFLHADIRKVFPSPKRDVLPEPVAGDVWEMQGVETGGMRSLPGEVYREAYGFEGKGRSPVAAPHYGFSFRTEFVYISMKRIPAAPDQQTSK